MDAEVLEKSIGILIATGPYPAMPIDFNGLGIRPTVSYTVSFVIA